MRAGAARAEQPEAVREALVPALLGGAASHHAGALPAWKSLVEGLFQRGLLKATARPPAAHLLAHPKRPRAW